MGTMMRRSGHEIAPAVGRIRQHRAKILVAEDDNDTRRVLCAALREDGYDVIEATSGFDLLGELSPALLHNAPGEGPDAIILDARIPGVTGLSILKGLRDVRWPTPIVIIARGREHDICEMSRRLGADATFEKPFDVDDLRTFVINAVPRAVGRAASRYLS